MTTVVSLPPKLVQTIEAPQQWQEEIGHDLSVELLRLIPLNRLDDLSLLLVYDLKEARQKIKELFWDTDGAY